MKIILPFSPRKSDSHCMVIYNKLGKEKVSGLDLPSASVLIELDGNSCWHLRRKRNWKRASSCKHRQNWGYAIVEALKPTNLIKDKNKLSPRQDLLAAVQIDSRTWASSEERGQRNGVCFSPDLFLSSQYPQLMRGSVWNYFSFWSQEHRKAIGKGASSVTEDVEWDFFWNKQRTQKTWNFNIRRQFTLHLALGPDFIDTYTCIVG